MTQLYIACFDELYVAYGLGGVVIGIDRRLWWLNRIERFSRHHDTTSNR
jgi:hypothetical protein